MSDSKLKLVNTKEEPSLRFGEYEYNETVNTLFVGRNGFHDGGDVNGTGRGVTEQDTDSVGT